MSELPEDKTKYIYLLCYNKRKEEIKRKIRGNNMQDIILCFPYFDRIVSVEKEKSEQYGYSNITITEKKHGTNTTLLTQTFTIRNEDCDAFIALFKETAENF